MHWVCLFRLATYLYLYLYLYVYLALPLVSAIPAGNAVAPKNQPGHTLDSSSIPAVPAGQGHNQLGDHGTILNQPGDHGTTVTIDLPGSAVSPSLKKTLAPLSRHVRPRPSMSNQRSSLIASPSSSGMVAPPQPPVPLSNGNSNVPSVQLKNNKRGENEGATNRRELKRGEEQRGDESELEGEGEGDGDGDGVSGRDDHARMYSQHELARLGVRGETRRQLQWDLQIAYENETFFDGWDFFSEPDPSHGLVNYVDHDTAFADGLAFWTSSGLPGIQAEHWATLAEGVTRNSVRITSKALFAGGLFIIDLALMPWGCGVWPAFWTLGYDKPWPDAGEIDIVEGIQAMTHNQMTIHTTAGCSINQTSSLYSGTVGNDNCDSSAGGSGCSIIDPSASSYGEPFNNAGGGVFAAQWDGDGINMWSWNRADIPSDIVSEAPCPQKWGTPVSAWDARTCDPYVFFSEQMLVLNIDLCGDWAGNTYAAYPYCPGTCTQQIANPANLVNTVMLINYIKVYQQSGTVSSTDQALSNRNTTGVGGATNHSISSSSSTSTSTSASSSASSSSSASTGDAPRSRRPAGFRHALLSGLGCGLLLAVLF